MGIAGKRRGKQGRTDHTLLSLTPTAPGSPSDDGSCTSSPPKEPYVVKVNTTESGSTLGLP